MSDQEDGEVIWTDEGNPKNNITLRNGILSLRSDRRGTYLVALSDLYRRETSAGIEQITMTVEPNPDAAAFHYGEVMAKLTEITGEEHPRGVRYGWDGFYDLAYRRIYESREEQIALAERIRDVLRQRLVKDGTRLELSPGEIRMIVYVEPAPKPA